MLFDSLGILPEIGLNLAKVMDAVKKLFNLVKGFGQPLKTAQKFAVKGLNVVRTISSSGPAKFALSFPLFVVLYQDLLRCLPVILGIATLLYVVCITSFVSKCGCMDMSAGCYFAIFVSAACSEGLKGYRGIWRTLWHFSHCGLYCLRSLILSNSFAVQKICSKMCKAQKSEFLEFEPLKHDSSKRMRFAKTKVTGSDIL